MYRGMEPVPDNMEHPSDYVEIRDILNDVVQTKLSGVTIDEGKTPPAISIKGPIGIRFVVNSSRFYEGSTKQRRGFKISYALADCGGEVNLAEGRSRMSTVISSPGFPLPYHHNLNCTWNITAPANRILSYKFTDLDLEVSSECAFDYVEIYDDVEFPNQTLGKVQRVCGNMAPDGQQTTRANHLLVRFVTDMNAKRGGFRMVVTATLGPANGCGGELEATGDWKTLTPPLNPANSDKYYEDLRCEWRIRARESRKILELRFMQLDMEVKRDQQAINAAAAAAAAVALGSTTTTVAPIAAVLSASWHTNTSYATEDSCYDFVVVYDGPKSTSPFLVPPTCAPPEDGTMPMSFYSSYQLVSVYFESDSYDEFRGFSMDYRAIDNDCGGLYLAGAEPIVLHYESDRTLTRTNQRHKRCRFFFYSEKQQPVEITFTDFSFPSQSADCTEEYVEIRDVGAVAECNHPACAHQQADVSTAQLRTCGAVHPPVFISKTSIVQLTTSVVLQSKYTAMFKLKYQELNACNRTVDLMGTTETGRLTSPNYPNSYAHDETCTTYLSAPRDRRILIVFRHFRIERGRQHIPHFRIFERPWHYRNSLPIYSETDASSSFIFDSTSCPYDTLSIYFNSSDPTQNVTLCGFSLPSSIISTQNKMTLSLITDSSMSYDGYELFYYSVSVELTADDDLTEKTIYELGTIRETSGALTHIPFQRVNSSDDSTQSYTQNSVLRVMIVPPLSMDCTFGFRHYEMSIAPSANYCGDYLTLERKIIDTSEKTLKLIDGAQARLPCKLESGGGKFSLPSGNAIYIEFHTDKDPSNDGTGFRLEWDCQPEKTIQF